MPLSVAKSWGLLDGVSMDILSLVTSFTSAWVIASLETMGGSLPNQNFRVPRVSRMKGFRDTSFMIHS